VNGLEQIVIQRLKQQSKYIQMVLSEREREDTFRLRRIKQVLRKKDGKKHARANQSILEVIQEKERELSTREADAKEDAIAFLKQAERTAAEFLREQTLRTRDEASMLWGPCIVQIMILISGA
jgi:hypothetical protein